MPNRDPSAPLIDRPLDPEAAQAIHTPGVAIIANEHSNFRALFREATDVATVRKRLLYVLIVRSTDLAESPSQSWEDQALQIARTVDAECAVFTPKDCIEGIRTYCTKMDIRFLITDQNRTRKFTMPWSKSLAQRIFLASGMPPVLIIRPDDLDEPIEEPAEKTRRWQTDWIIQTVAIGGISILGYSTRNMLPEAFHVLLYVFVLALTASRVSTLVSAVGSVMATIAFDAIHVGAIRKLDFSDSRVWFNLIGLLVVTLMISTLSWQLRESLSESKEREHRQAAFILLARDLISANSLHEASMMVVNHIQATYRCSVVVFVLEDGQIKATTSPDSNMERVDADSRARTASIQYAIETGYGTATFPLAKGLYIPILTNANTIGCISVVFSAVNTKVSQDQLRALHSFASLLGQSLLRIMVQQEQKTSEIKLQSAETQSTLLKGISHDLKTPLTTMSGFAAQLAENPDMPREERAQRYSAIRTESSRLRHMIDNLLSMTRLESGVMEPNFEVMFVEEVVGTVVSQSQPQLVNHNLRVVVAPDVCDVHVDPILFNQALVNLIENAVKYSPQQTEILLEAKNVGEEVELSLSDNGPGLAKGDLIRVFDKFVRLGDGKAAEGTGLGLAIVKMIVELHGGRVNVENRPTGGAKFSIRLPRSVVNFSSPDTVNP